MNQCKVCGGEIDDSIGSSLGYCENCWQDFCADEFAQVCDTIGRLQEMEEMKNKEKKP